MKRFQRVVSQQFEIILIFFGVKWDLYLNQATRETNEKITDGVVGFVSRWITNKNRDANRVHSLIEFIVPKLAQFKF